MSDKVQKFVDAFFAMAESKDMSDLDNWLADEVALYTPRFHKPITDRNHFKAVIAGIFSLTQDLNYSNQRHWVNGNELVFEFRGKVGEYEMHGVDIITLNDEGKMKTVSVMIRPPKALEALAKKEDEFILKLLKQSK